MDPKPNQLMSCPFNLAHQVENYRLQGHLTKCMKQHPNVRAIACPFNNNHIVKREEIDHHVSTCPDRVLLDVNLYVTDEDRRPPVQLHHNTQDFACTENWDDDNAETYNPQEAKKNVIIYNKIKGATKSERNKFRYENSIKFSQALAQQQSAAGPSQPGPGPSSDKPGLASGSSG